MCIRDRQLGVGAGVGEHGVGLGLSCSIHEPHPAARCDYRVERREQVETRFGVEKERTLIHAVLADPPSEVAQVCLLYTSRCV